jgi:hypothetical protein
MKQRQTVIIVLAMVVIAAGAVLVSHYAFSSHSPAFTTPTTAPTTAPNSQAYRACVADGATISTAIAAFDAQNPGTVPTEASLVGGTANSNGPYLQGWANNPNFYVYILKNGILYLRSSTSGTTPIQFTGPSSCTQIGL